MPQPPQLSLSLKRFVQRPVHCTRLPVHAQPASAQPSPGPHAWLHAPQSFKSVRRFAQRPGAAPQRVSPPAQVVRQVLALHDWPPSHGASQAPQFIGSRVTSTQAPLHTCCCSGFGHTQLELRQFSVGRQGLPHAPQFSASSVTSVHWPLHSRCPVGQTGVHVPVMHVLSLEHVWPQVPQFCSSRFRSLQPAEQALSPVLQVIGMPLSGAESCRRRGLPAGAGTP